MHAKNAIERDNPLFTELWRKPQTNDFSKKYFILLQKDRLQLTAVYCNRRGCVRTTPQKPVFSLLNMQDFGIQIEMTGHNRTATSRLKEFCTWLCVCVVKCSWRKKLSWGTLRRPTAMTTWKPRPRESTRSTREWTRNCYSLLSPCSVSAVTLISCTHRMTQDVRVLVSSHACMNWTFSLTFLILSLSSSSFFPIILKQFFLPFTFQRLSSKIPVHFVKEMGIYWRILLPHIWDRFQSVYSIRWKRPDGYMWSGERLKERQVTSR